LCLRQSAELEPIIQCAETHQKDLKRTSRGRGHERRDTRTPVHPYTIGEITRRPGLSTATVDRVLNSRGTGPDEVGGPVADLLLLATGRPAGLAGVSGPGTEKLAATLS
jgi:hypothetical protein